MFIYDSKFPGVFGDAVDRYPEGANKRIKKKIQPPFSE